jgi:hypothetical protein
MKIAGQVSPGGGKAAGPIAQSHSGKRKLRSLNPRILERFDL